MNELWFGLMLNTGLLAGLLFLQPAVRVMMRGSAYALGNLDIREDEGIFASRLEMVKSNQIEAVALLIPVVLYLQAMSITGSLVTTAIYTHVVARLLYIAVALAGIPMVRSLIWLVSFAAWAFLAAQGFEII